MKALSIRLQALVANWRQHAEAIRWPENDIYELDPHAALAMSDATHVCATQLVALLRATPASPPPPAPDPLPRPERLQEALTDILRLMLDGEDEAALKILADLMPATRGDNDRLVGALETVYWQLYYGEHVEAMNLCAKILHLPERQPRLMHPCPNLDCQHRSHCGHADEHEATGACFDASSVCPVHQPNGWTPANPPPAGETTEVPR
jgi:hypothetical protein